MCKNVIAYSFNDFCSVDTLDASQLVASAFILLGMILIFPTCSETYVDMNQAVAFQGTWHNFIYMKWIKVPRLFKRYDLDTEKHSKCLLSKCWANFEQVSRKCSASDEQMLSKYWANAEQVLSK